MKLASKLVLLFLACLACVVVVFSYLSMRQTQDLMLAEHERHAADLAASLELAIADSPQPLEQLDRKLLAWSRSIEHLEVRLVEPRSQSDLRRPAVPNSMLRLTREIVTIRYRDAGGDPRLYTYIPMDRRTRDGDGEISDEPIRLEVSAPESFWGDQLSTSLRTAAIGLTVVALFTSIVILIGGYWMVGQPLKAILRKVNQVAMGELDCPIEMKRNDELGQLGTAINDMCVQLENKQKAIETQTAEKVAAVEQLRHTDRLRTVGRLAAGIAHELGTPLNVVSGRAELISSGRLQDEQVVESANAIKAQTDRIATIVRQLLDFSRQGNTAKEKVDLQALLEQCVELLRPLAGKRGVELKIADRDPMEQPRKAMVNAGQIQQVVTNLIVNAIQASDRGSSVDLSIRPVEKQELEQMDGHDKESICESCDLFWAIEVRDRGRGILPEHVEQLFEPFFTTKDVGEGTGLGLSISSNIVREHQGTIAVSSNPSQGSCFTVLLPAEKDAE